MKKNKEVTEIVEVKQKIKGMREMVDNIKVTNDEELGEVADKIKGVKTLAKFVKQQKEKYTEPAKAIIAEARTMYDPMIKECQNAEIVLKGRANSYMSEKERLRIEKEKKIADRVERGTLKVETAMKKVEALPEISKTVKTDTGSKLQQAKRRVAKIVDPTLIPKEYWVVDEVRVRRDALLRDKSNMEPIPGVEIVEETYLTSM